jgi:hypothetical protein
MTGRTTANHNNFGSVQSSIHTEGNQSKIVKNQFLTSFDLSDLQKDLQSQN